MKRFATVLLVLVLAGSVLPAAAEPQAWAEGYQIAEADWIVMEGRSKATYYFVAGARSASPEGLVTYGVVGSGPCDVERGKNWMMIVCTGFGRGKELSIDQFQIDPALRSASLKMKSNGVTNVATWRGRGQVPFNGGSVYGGDGMAGADVMTARAAGIKARLLGRQMPKATGHSMTFAWLAQGASAGVYNEGRSFEFAPDGSYSYEVRFRVPR